MNINCSYSEMRDLVGLTEHPRNSNKHSEKQIDMLARIMTYQGWRHPIVVSKRSGFIVAGHGRLMAAKQNGWNSVPVDVQDFPDEAAELSFLISDNKIAELSHTDDNMMIDIIKEFELDDFELLGLDNFSLEEKELKNTGAELDLDSFDNFDHECPKCGFEWSDNGADNS